MQEPRPQDPYGQGLHVGTVWVNFSKIKEVERRNS